MTRFLLFCLLGLPMTGCRSGDEPNPPPAPPATGTTSSETPRFSWPVPDGWRSETIPFPLEFAPEIPHRGVEELRFAPGFFEPEAPGYFSYAFAWVVSGESALDIPTLARELTTYFRGLMGAVGKGKKGLPALDLDRTEARIGADGRGSVVTFDAFGDGRQIDLEVTVAVQPCGSGKAVLFTAAPHGRPPVSPSPQDVTRSFRCE
jgi:hypothetical protein